MPHWLSKRARTRLSPDRPYSARATTRRQSREFERARSGEGCARNDGRSDWRTAHSKIAETLAHHVAEWLCALARASDREFAVCLSGGSTPRRLYEWLATPAIASRFPWGRVHWFWGDERFVPHDHPDSNYPDGARRVPFARPRSRLTTFTRFRPKGLSPEQAAAAYEATLKRFYGADTLAPDRPLFDVTLLGIGEDGHTASLFPGQPALQETRRWVVAVIGANAEPRITLTYPALDSSRDVAFLVTGKGKAGRRRARAGRRSRRSRGHGSSGRASALVYGSRRGRRRSEVMSRAIQPTKAPHPLLPRW